MSRTVPLLVLPLLLLGLGPLSAASKGVENQILSDSEMDLQFTERRKELAARYRVERALVESQLPEAYHREAERALAQVQQALIEHDLPTARELAQTAYETYPYSEAADDLVHSLLRSYAVSGDLRLARQYLIDLWERFPAYEHFRSVLNESLVVAEYIQQRGSMFNFQAEHPSEVIDRSAMGDLVNAKYLLHFLARHGDQHEIAPRATLGLARGILIQAGGSLDRLVEARLAYDEFLDRYPESSLVFEALVEQAVSHLLTYRGDQYDMGALVNAKTLIEQADLYTGQDTGRQEVVARFRSLIRRWHQERDLQIARWYRNQDQLGPARYYYTEVIGKDPTAKAAVAARRERSRLPEAAGQGLGSATVERPR